MNCQTNVNQLGEQAIIRKKVLRCLCSPGGVPLKAGGEGGDGGRCVGGPKGGRGGGKVGRSGIGGGDGGVGGGHHAEEVDEDERGKEDHLGER